MVRLESPNGEPESNDPRLAINLASRSEVDEDLDRVSSRHQSGGEIEYVIRNSNITPVWKRRPSA